ncbi:MAG: helix-turn-helix transcriptional regulator [Candidatus Glassbacteria bacterium]|nr:helix-turn-helix transcriptional regulator [Candidatus Glassbacteria bacterium]
MWLELLKREVADTSQARAAARIGYSPATVNLIMHGKYEGNLENVAAKVLAALGTVECPWLGREIHAARCAAYSTRPVPSNSPEEVKFWRHCQRCEAWQPSTGQGGTGKPARPAIKGEKP